MQLPDLNADVCHIMADEVQYDVDNGSMFLSTRLNPSERLNYVRLLRAATLSGSVQWFARELENSGYLLKKELRRKPNGGLIMVRLPLDAAETIAETEFKRFYIRALCICTIVNENRQALVLYDTRIIASTLPSVPTWVGKRMRPDLLLAILRRDHNIASALGVPEIHSRLAMVRISELDKT